MKSMKRVLLPKTIKSAGLLMFLLFSGVLAQAQQITVTGTVKDSKAEAMAGVSVAVKGTSNGTTTDAIGQFTLVVSPNDKLVFSFIGYKSKEIEVANQSSISVSMEEDLTTLSEVVVIGYGTAKKADISSSISSISEKDFKTLVITGADQALQGKVAGVNVTSNSGQPGGGVSVRVRGITTVNGNEPLYVIDGVPILTSTKSTAQDQLGGIAGQTTQSVLATLNPADIVSIDILKDASAQAIYGSMAGNGVVLITTKRGKAGEGKLTYDVYYGWQDVVKKLPLMNLRQYAEYYNSVVAEGTVSGLQSIGEFENPSLLGKGTDWQDAIFQQGSIQNHQLSFSGGQEKTTYFFSGNYYDQTGTVIGSGFKRYALRASVDQQVKTWLKAGVSANLSRSNQKVTLTDGQQSVIALMMYNSPATPLKTFDGSYNTTISISGASFGQTQNPVALALLRDVRAEQSKGYGNVYAELQFTKDLVFRNQLNYDFQLSENTAFQPNISNETTGQLIIGPSKLREDRNTSYYWGLQNYLSYNHTFAGRHAINVVAGHEAAASHYDNVYVSATNLTQNIANISAGTIDASASGSGKGSWAMESYFARGAYTYDNRYSVSGSFRRDGSASFGPGNRWGNFAAGSASWTITNENFSDNWNPNYINTLKLRAGVGAVGNSSTSGSSLYTTNIRLVTGANGLFGQSTVAGVPANVGNPDLSWESVFTYNAGVDIGSLSNRINLTVDVYKKITTDMIIATTLPSFAGLDPNPPNNAYQDIEPPTTNAGKMTNTGIDISITTDNIETSDFTWKTSIIFSAFKNVLNKLNSDQAALYGKSQDFTPQTLTVTTKGHPVGSFYGFVTDGLYRTEEELNSGPTPMLAVNNPNGTWLGDIRYKDITGDGKITTDDQTFIGNPSPKFTYGMTNTISYKGFDLSVFFTGVYGNKIFNYSRLLDESMTSVYDNQLTTVMDRYTATNTDGKLPRYNQWNGNNTKISDRYIEDGTYLRLQNISLGYNLPAKWIGRAKMTSARIYVSGQNIFTITNYSGYDPELGSYNNNVLTQNIDYGHYPNARSITIGANIEF